MKTEITHDLIEKTVRSKEIGYEQDGFHWNNLIVRSSSQAVTGYLNRCRSRWGKEIWGGDQE